MIAGHPYPSAPRAGGSLYRGVLMVSHEYPPFPGGIATYAAALSQAIQEEGHPVDVIAPRYEETAAGDEPQVQRILRHHHLTPRIAARALTSLMRINPAQRIHACDLRSVLLASLARRLGGPRYQAAIHGSEVLKFAGRHPLKPLVASAYRGAERICANSHATLATYEASFGRAPQAQVTWLGVDAHWFQSAPSGRSRAPALADLQDLVVCSVGRIDNRKGHAQALQVVAEAQRRLGRKITYVAAGALVDTALAGKLRTSAQELDIDLRLPGRLPIDEVKRLYRRSICHLLLGQPIPGKLEGFGLVILEAAAQRCPTVATRLGGAPEVLAAAQAGVSIDPLDLAGAAAQLCEWALSPRGRAHAGAAARKGARDFTWRRCAVQSFPELFPHG